MKADQMEEVIEELDDIISSGYGGEFTEWHRAEIDKMLTDQNLSDRDLKSVFREYYAEPGEGVTVAEIKWMMTKCGVKSFTIRNE